MQSIFHVKANTADELRRELVTWLESEQMRSENYRDQIARTKKDIMLANARAKAMENAAKFWADIIIDPKSEGN